MNTIKQKLSLIMLLMAATITQTSYINAKKNIQTEKSTLDIEQQTSEHWITIWVHGTRLTPKIFFKKFFHVPIGLKKATDLDPSYHHHEIAQTLFQLNEQHFDLSNFYLYGWSGKLSFTKRYHAAQELYTAISALIAEYHKTYGVNPRIRIITHSHGGNVALNLARCASKSPTFHIDELVLLACPVQDQTKDFIKHPLFKNIYSLYSTIDMLQVADPQGIFDEEQHEDFFDRDWFSQRTFPEHPKLKQAEITYNGRGILHVEFLLIKKMCGFINHLPEIINMLAHTEQSHQKINLK